MPRSKALRRAALTAALLVSTHLFAAQPYHLELEAAPAAVFPYLGKFGTVEIHVYAGGVRAEALWLNSFSRNGAPDVTVMNPLGRMYVEVAVAEIPSILRKIAGTAAGVERIAAPTVGSSVKGRVGTIDATRHRLVYGPDAYIDVWTTNVVPENRQLRRIVNALLEGISPGTARAAARLPGTPINVELNFRRFQKVNLLKVKKLTMAADDEEDALTRGALYVRASVLEKLWN